MRLSKHFVDHWHDRVGGIPTVEDVQTIMREGVVVQRGRQFALMDGTIFTILGVYWNKNVVVTIDELKGIAVSCYTPSLENKKLCSARNR